ncbi:hypothetical protein EMPS_03272 [Entomortierella parvispora]|uniref:F-box domain-containing protein n=1 Tax=Entomortierella parvispora TaxID=205924 RepID=A0A9P3H729_9FUNG|nr:hypothetical protein EMPS_03272 [Entomortierella parvispora]
MSIKIRRNYSPELGRPLQHNPTASTDHAPRTAFVPPSKPSPMEINEILSSVFSFLDQKTLKDSVSPVCRQWNSVAARYILRTIRVHHDSRKPMENLQSRLLKINALEVGRKIYPSAWPLSLKETHLWEEVVDKLTQALERIQSDGGGDTSASHLQIKALTLSLEVPNRLDQLLSLVVPSNLRELTIDCEYSKNPVHLGTVLDMCSNLLHLTLTSNKVIPIRDHVLGRSEAWLSPDSVKEGRRPHPLRSLRIRNMCASPINLQSYFPRLGNLIELHYYEERSRPDDSPQDSLLMDNTRQIFLQTLVQNCPLLESLHIPLSHHQGYRVPVELFPKVHDYCMNNGDVTTVSLLEGILANGVESRLTRLEMIATKSYGYIGRDINLTANRPDDLLHQVLCSAPRLVYLKAAPRPVWSTVLWGQGSQTDAWACRRLKTLDLTFESDLPLYRGYKTETRHIFAFISRFCPELEELRLQVGSAGLSLKSGLCLLSRLRHLQYVTLKGNYLSEDAVNRQELAWIQTPSHLTPPQTSKTSSWLPKIFQSSPAKGTPSAVVESYLHCIDTVQSLKGSAGKDDRLRMQQQQKGNQYSSNYTGLSIPMVDGLVDTEFSGSFLEIEACLQAQLFRLQRLQQLQALSGSRPPNDILAEELEEAAKAAAVWPNMKSMRLVHEFPRSSRSDLNFKEAQSRVEKGSQAIYGFRPEIYIIQHG